jgi:hypothetical protein
MATLRPSRNPSSSSVVVAGRADLCATSIKPEGTLYINSIAAALLRPDTKPAWRALLTTRNGRVTITDPNGEFTLGITDTGKLDVCGGPSQVLVRTSWASAIDSYDLT